MPGTVVLSRILSHHLGLAEARRPLHVAMPGELPPNHRLMVLIKALMATGSQRVLGLLFASLLTGFGGLAVSNPAFAVYAIAQYGEPKYPAGFKHFDYVNPDAPRGGTLVLANPDRLTSFDKFNPFTMRGNTAPGIGVLFESLTTGSSDEVASAYGLLADDISVAPAGLSTTFHIHPRPHFSNDDPGTADAVKF